MGEWDMHDVGAVPFVDENDRLAAGTKVTGVVVCHHEFGLGVQLDGRGDYGHVDIVAIAPRYVRLAGPQDFPPIGTEVAGRVLGYAGDQLGLSLREE
jgi:predicted RNA-binding protein with RPS1 domain